MTNLSRWQFRIVLALCALGFCIFLAMALFPFHALKLTLDSLMPDGDFETLTEATAVVVRIWLVLAAGLCAFELAAAGRGASGRRVGFGSFRSDAVDLWRAIRPHDADGPWILCVGVILALALALRLPRIMAGLNHDEAYTVMTFGRSLPFALTNYHVPNNHILHTVLVYFSATLLGPAPWAVRMPALLAGVATIVGLYFFGRDTYSRFTGFGAALLLAVSSAHIGSSVKARGYSLLALFAVLAFWVAVHARRRKSLAAWLLVSLFSSLGAFTIPVMVYPYAVLMAWLLAEGILGPLGEGYRSRRHFLLFWTASGLATGVLVFALYTPALMVTGPERMVAIGRVAPNLGIGFIEALFSNLAQMAGAWAGSLPQLVRWLVVAGLGLGLLLHRRLSWLAVPMQVVAIVVVGGFIVVQRPNYDARIWFSFLPLVALWVSAGTVGVVELGQRRYCPRFPLTAGLLALCLVLAGGMGIHALESLPEAWANKGREEQAVLLLKEAVHESDRIVAPASRMPMLRYYARVHQLSQDLMGHTSEFDRLFLITYPGDGQTMEVVLRSAGLEGTVDLGRAQSLGEIMGLEIIQVPGP
jgi:hypothetical protein